MRPLLVGIEWSNAAAIRRAAIQREVETLRHSLQAYRRHMKTQRWKRNRLRAFQIFGPIRDGAALKRFGAREAGLGPSLRRPYAHVHDRAEVLGYCEPAMSVDDLAPWPIASVGGRDPL